MLVYGKYECFVMTMLYVCVLWWKVHFIETTHQKGLARTLMVYGCYIIARHVKVVVPGRQFATSSLTIHKYNHLYYVETVTKKENVEKWLLTMKVPRG